MREREGCGERKTGRMREDEREREYGWREREKRERRLVEGGIFWGKWKEPEAKLYNKSRCSYGEHNCLHNDNLDPTLQGHIFKPDSASHLKMYLDLSTA